MKLGDLKGALFDADFAIRDGKNNAKAFYRQGQVGVYVNQLFQFSCAFNMNQSSIQCVSVLTGSSSVLSDIVSILLLNCEFSSNQ